MTHPISTTAPMPTISDLIAGTALDHAALMTPWCRAGDRGAVLARAGWALRAIVEGHAKVRGALPSLWVPDYFCNSALAFVRELQAPIVFYPITEHFEPDWSTCETMATEAPPSLFLQVHYFGWPSEATRGRAFCEAHGAALIEDAAHALAPCPGIGQIGDYVIWSLYKHVPSPDGALLVARNRTPAGAAALATAHHLAAKGPAPIGLWRARRLIQILAPSLATRLRQKATAFDEDPVPAPHAALPGMSTLSRNIVARYLSSLSELVTRRRMNEAALRAALENCKGLSPALPPPLPGVAPYRAVFRAESPEQARSWYERFFVSGNAIETWPDLPPEVYGAPERHRVALTLRRSCFGLPVHADRTPQELVAAYGPVCA